MPYLILKENKAFFEFIQTVFNAKEKLKIPNQDGTGVIHAETLMGGHCLMYSSPDPFPEQPSGLSICVENVDESHKKAVGAGATSLIEPFDMDWGRMSGVKDPVGNTWWIVSAPKDKIKKERPLARPYLSPKDAGGFLDFLKKVFDAKEEKPRMTAPDTGKILHAEALVAENVIMINSGSEEKFTQGAVSVAVPNVDEVYKKALAEGATSIVEPADHPWGRFSGWKDPFGQTWWVVSEQAEATENVNPYFSVKGCDELMDFVKKTFDAEEKFRRLTPEGSVYHGELKVLGTTLMFAEGSEAMGYTTTGVSVGVPDVDDVYNKAMAAGAISKYEPTDAQWGKFCHFEDRFGNAWMIQHKPKKEIVHDLWPYLAVKDAPAFLEFLKKVFNAEEKMRRFQDDGKTIMHAEAAISGGTIMLSEGSEEQGYRNGGVFVYVTDADETHKIALAEGATELMAPCDMSDGRGSGIKDPFGNTFWLASSKKKNEGNVDEDILGKRNGNDHPDESSEPAVDKKIKE